MIGGEDIVIPASGYPAALDACARIVQRYWPQAKFEDALTGEKYASYAHLPFGRLREVLIYPDASAEAAWDGGKPDVAANTMLYLLLSPSAVTIVVDDPRTEDMRSILESMRKVLEMDILNTEAELAIAEAASTTSQ